MMTPYSTDILRSLKWMQNNAPRIQSIIRQKANWYQLYQEQFWINWQANVYDLRTANTFGLVVWCIILGIPLDLFTFEAISSPWAYGKQRLNYLDGGGHKPGIHFTDGPHFFLNGSPVDPSLYTFDSATDEMTFTSAPPTGEALTWTGTVTQPETGQTLVINQPRPMGTTDGTTTVFSLIPANSANYNETGGNFYGGGNSSVSSLNEIRFACQLRYAALVSNGRQQWINYMLRFIFNGGDAWNYPLKRYVYLVDNTLASQPVTGETITSTIGGVTTPVTDYTIDRNAGVVTFATPPAVGAVLAWTGSWQWASPSSPQQFGVGNGIATVFNLTKPPGWSSPVTADNYMEYRIGAGMGLSDQFINILNNPAYGIMPQCAGIKYAVVKES